MRNAGATYDIEGERRVYANQNRINRVIERLYGAKAFHLFYVHIIRIYAKTISLFFYRVVSYSTYLHVRLLAVNIIKPKGDAIGRP